ncbi:MAG: dihydropteroate synthase [Thermodesulfobacteriota bacterium]
MRCDRLSEMAGTIRETQHAERFPSHRIPLTRTVLDATQHTLIMGIINVTPDSFSDGGVHFNRESAVSSALEMLDAGADIVDVGGESTRPGSEFVEADEEKARSIPVIEGIMAHRPDAVVSIDTRRRKVAEAALKAGAQIINDVSGFRHDSSLVDLGRESGAALVVMHMLGSPRTMQKEIRYHSFPEDIYDFFTQRIGYLEDSGIDPAKIVIDPGIGFGKTFDQNLTLLNRLDFFSPLGKHIMVGASRKAFLGRILDEPVAGHRDQGTLATTAAAILRGASIVRVHDVASTIPVSRVADAIRRERVNP